MFEIILDLLDEHKVDELLGAISAYSEFASKDEENDLGCRERSARIHLALQTLLAEMELLDIISLRKQQVYGEGNGEAAT